MFYNRMQSIRVRMVMVGNGLNYNLAGPKEEVL